MELTHCSNQVPQEEEAHFSPSSLHSSNSSAITSPWFPLFRLSGTNVPQCWDAPLRHVPTTPYPASLMSTGISRAHWAEGPGETCIHQFKSCCWPLFRTYESSSTRRKRRSHTSEPSWKTYPALMQPWLLWTWGEEAARVSVLSKPSVCVARRHINSHRVNLREFQFRSRC